MARRFFALVCGLFAVLSGHSMSAHEPTAERLPPFLDRAVTWLVEAQHNDGGWGSDQVIGEATGSKRRQETDAATTAIAGLALLRNGSNLQFGPHRDSVIGATQYLLRWVESIPEDQLGVVAHPAFFRQATYPRQIYGDLVDTSLTTQFLSRLLLESHQELLDDDRIRRALKKCVHRLQLTQRPDGSWNYTSRRPALNAAFCSTALELAHTADVEVPEAMLRRVREYQRMVLQQWAAKTGWKMPLIYVAGQWIDFAFEDDDLSVFAPVMRTNIAEAFTAESLIAEAAERGAIEPAAAVMKDNLLTIGVPGHVAESMGQAWRFHQLVAIRLRSKASPYWDVRLLFHRGTSAVLHNQIFGFLRHEAEFAMLWNLSDALVMADAHDEREWRTDMAVRLSRYQREDGSWTYVRPGELVAKRSTTSSVGTLRHGGVTHSESDAFGGFGEAVGGDIRFLAEDCRSRAFCTAAVILCLTADRDATVLRRIPHAAATKTVPPAEPPAGGSDPVNAASAPRRNGQRSFDPKKEKGEIDPAFPFSG